MDKRSLSERDICTKFITPALRGAGCDEISQLREEVTFTAGRIVVRGKLVARRKRKRADYILSVKPNIPIAVIEAKDNNHTVGDGMQQAPDYAETLHIPFAFSSNGDGFVFHDRTGGSTPPEVDLPLNAFPSPDDLWDRYRTWKWLRRRATTRSTPSTRPSRPSPRGRTASCWSWPRARARRKPRSRSSGGDGRSASCSWPTATCSSTRRWRTISSPSAAR